ncbi:12637_t:CDS:2, partial [Cetraspora pellucida]
LIDKNKTWVDDKNATDPSYFENLAKGQKPKFIWIGCSDSRFSPELITKSDLGEIFVLRNIANQFNTTDLNALSVLKYAIEYLEVRQIIVCGHYKCGGINASINNCGHGVIDHWLQSINEIYLSNKLQLDDKSEKERENLLSELNIKKQVQNISTTSIVQDAWNKDFADTGNG